MNILRPPTTSHDFGSLHQMKALLLSRSHATIENNTLKMSSYDRTMQEQSSIKIGPVFQSWKKQAS